MPQILPETIAATRGLPAAIMQFVTEVYQKLPEHIPAATTRTVCKWVTLIYIRSKLSQQFVAGYLTVLIVISCFLLYMAVAIRAFSMHGAWR